LKEGKVKRGGGKIEGRIKALILYRVRTRDRKHAHALH
jgi:hypothetical protein